MRFFQPFAVAVAISLSGLLAACSEPTPTSEEAIEAEVTDSYDMMASRKSIAQIEMAVDTSFLSEEERQVINRLNMVGNLMSEIYLRQAGENNPEIRAEIAASNLENKDAILDMFDLHFGPWDTFHEGHPFYGDTPMPAGGGFDH